MSTALPYAKSEANTRAQQTVRDWYDGPTTPFSTDDSFNEQGLGDTIEQELPSSGVPQTIMAG